MDSSLLFFAPHGAPFAQVVKLVDTLSSGGSAFGRGGSSPPLSILSSSKGDFITDYIPNDSIPQYFHEPLSRLGSSMLRGRFDSSARLHLV